MPTLISRVATAVRTRGFSRVVKDFAFYRTYRTARWLRSLHFDLRHGVDTRGASLDVIRNRQSLIAAVDSDNRRFLTGFGSTDPKLIDGVLENLPIRHKDYVFIDLGCGTGRVLLLASAFPFKRICGVEFCPDVCEQAKKNVTRFGGRDQQCREFDIQLQDAIAYELPPDPLVLYLFNPFSEPAIMEGIMQNISNSLRQHPRTIFVIYCNPVLAPVLLQAGILEETQAYPFCRIYSNVRFSQADSARRA